MTKANIIIERNFQRSMRLDSDVSSDALKGYVLQRTVLQALTFMSQQIAQSVQRAFTLTGPFGSGKSSFALLLCALVGDKQHQKAAKAILGEHYHGVIGQAFAAEKAWKVMPVVGHPARIVDDLAKILHLSDVTDREVLKRITLQAESKEGLLLVLDELGKYLESDYASENAYFLQELAECANRHAGKFVLLGILHQAFDAYASRFSRELQDEFAKVQGRFSDISLLASSDEMIELLSHAIVTRNANVSHSFKKSVSLVVKDWARNRAVDAESATQLLEKCWPLSPVTSVLLGPISRRKFSQNERSIFSFLASREPLGFTSFIEERREHDIYSPALYFDYLKTNFEASILSSNDSHRWIIAQDAIDRAARVCDEKRLAVAKTIALIDLFRAGSGIEATKGILRAASGRTEAQLDEVLKKLKSIKVIIDRHHTRSYAMFAGSDFDLDAKMTERLAQQRDLESSVFTNQVQLTPIVAQRHYVQTGTLRWFRRVLLQEKDLDAFWENYADKDAVAGKIVLVLADEKADKALERLTSCYALELSKYRNVLFGVARSATEILSLAKDLQAIQAVSRDPLLEGDETGRREVHMRQHMIATRLQELLSKAFTNANLRFGDKTVEIRSHFDLVTLASQCCDQLYDTALSINNELINREHVSTNIVRARRALMYRMVENGTERSLGFEGFPPEYSLYLSLLKEYHQEENGVYRFVFSDEQALHPFWQRTMHFLQQQEEVTLARIYSFWKKAPIGLPFGPMPILALLFFLSHQEQVAMYINKAFKSSIDIADVDEWIIDSRRVSFRYLEDCQAHKRLVQKLAFALNDSFALSVDANVLDVARALVKIVLESPKWSQRTMTMSKDTINFKQVVAHASDPIELIYKNLFSIYQEEDIDALVQRVINSLREIQNAMPAMLEKVRQHLFKVLNDTDLNTIHERASVLKGTTGLMQLEAFIARLTTYDAKDADVIGFISLACSRPQFAWTDRDIDSAIYKLADLAYDFRQHEAFVSVKEQTAKRRVFTVVSADSRDDMKVEYEVSDVEECQAKELAERLFVQLQDRKKDVSMSVLTHLCQLIQSKR